MPMCNITGSLYNASGEVIEYGIVTFQLQQDIVYGGNKIVPFTVTIDLSETSGTIDVTLFPNANAAPTGTSYKLEFDPDPDDRTKPMKSKPGYFRNYISVPDSASASLGEFVSALRGSPSNNYMPIGGTVSSFSDTVTMGSATNTNKGLRAPQVGFTPEIRFNATTDEWEFTNNGSTWQNVLQGGGGSVGGDLSGTVGSATVAKIQGHAVSTTDPTTTGQVLRWNNSSSQYEPSVDGTGLNVSASNATTGTLPLARLSGITNTEISASAAIAWSKISKVGASVADLTFPDETVTFAKMQHLAASKLAGRGSASGTGDIEAITIGSGLTMTGTTLSASASAPAMNDLTDATITSVANRDLLQWDGSAWVNVASPRLTSVGIGVAADANSKLNVVGQYGSKTHDAGNSGSSIGLDWANGNTQLLTLTGNATITLSNPIDGYRYLIALKQDGTGSRTVTWPSNIKWPGGSAPVLTTTAGHVDVITLVYFSGLGASGNYLAAANYDYTPA